MVGDVVFLIWRFHRGDLARYRIKNLFMQESEKNSDDRISEGESESEEEGHEGSFEDEVKMERVNDYEIETNEAEAVARKKGHRSGKVERKNKNMLVLTESKKEETEENLDMLTEKDEKNIKKIVFNKQKNKKNKMKDV
jgi:hypothetical protein